MKFKGKIESHGMTNRTEHVHLDGRIIASFVNGSFETEDATVIAGLKKLGYESDEPKPEPKEEPKGKGKK